MFFRVCVKQIEEVEACMVFLQTDTAFPSFYRKGRLNKKTGQGSLPTRFLHVSQFFQLRSDRGN